MSNIAKECMWWGGEPGYGLKEGSRLCVSESQRIGLGKGDSGAVVRQVGPGPVSLEKVQEEEPEDGGRKEHQHRKLETQGFGL